MSSFRIIAFFACLVSLVISSPVQRRENAAPTGPILSADFPDPSIIKIRDTWYSFSTSSGDRNVQVASSRDFRTWTLITENGQIKDALPRLGDWVTTDASGNPMVWAPDVIKRDDGMYVLYYSALNTPRLHCIGHATSYQITGPYTPAPTALICGDTTLSQGGAIDASGLREPDGSRYIAYKIDGNAIGSGGNCGNGDGARSTPIMLQPVAEDGVTFVGPAIKILDRDVADGPLVEAPSIIRLDDGRHALFFSSNCYTSPMYDVSYAISESGVAGPYAKSDAPLLITGMYGLTAPGGASVWNVQGQSGYKMVFHANSNTGRSMWSADLDVSGRKISLI
ncbi:Arabinanase/levansucrase/invertase [Pseudovirgaria hyperparasitica]|uniref:Arabinanase/levansucrase/invertase n=1 Tax=Pseudovirgaria hyperparasitica TaxID=470096 RepID=A0A6A6VXB4_9PEZI|nr:Arabinanase/levansucrase/invertase [Pseudovirgaria hyperparasitica]KAF2754479.1 Arabinanase/levansucrase/invertase [Pseudovirgaria hyperparasitica]